VSSNTIIKNLIVDSVTVNYLFNTIGTYNTHFTITGNIYGKYTNIWNPSGSNLKKYSLPGNDFNIVIPTIPYREIENGTIYTLTNNSTDSIPIGDKTYNRTMTINYEIVRGSTYSNGTINITNKNSSCGTIETSNGDDTGIVFNGAYFSGNIIKLKWTSSNTGTAAEIRYNVTRQMY
jgi:hypothetical protein